MFSLICARINGWVNNVEAGDLRRHRVHYDVIVMRHEVITYEKPHVFRNPSIKAQRFQQNGNCLCSGSLEVVQYTCISYEGPQIFYWYNRACSTRDIITLTSQWASSRLISLGTRLFAFHLKLKFIRWRHHNKNTTKQSKERATCIFRGITLHCKIFDSFIPNFCFRTRRSTKKKYIKIFFCVV